MTITAAPTRRCGRAEPQNRAGKLTISELGSGNQSSS